MENNKPLVTVLMSVYNAEKYLTDSIESILKQSYKNIEFLIINDGSTDDSLNIINNFAKKDSRIVVINQQNIGLTKSLNKGISLSTGKYIVRQDADDISLLNRIEMQLNYMNSFSCDFVFCRSCSFINSSYYLSPELNYIEKINFNQLAFGNIFIHGTFFCKAELLKKEYYNEEYKYAQDFELFSRLIKKKYKFFILPDVLYFLRIDDNSISISKKDEQNEYAKKVCKTYFGSSKYFIADKPFLLRIILKFIRKYIK